MRRIKLVLAALVVMVASFAAFAGPAMAADRDDNGWNNNGWNNNGWNNNGYYNNWYYNNLFSPYFVSPLLNTFFPFTFGTPFLTTNTSCVNTGIVYGSYYGC